MTDETKTVREQLILAGILVPDPNPAPPTAVIRTLSSEKSAMLKAKLIRDGLLVPGGGAEPEETLVLPRPLAQPVVQREEAPRSLAEVIDAYREFYGEVH